MKVYPIRIIGLLLMFIIAVWISISDIESSQVFSSFVAMLVAIFVLFVAYEYLSYSLGERLKKD
jgi:Flp pilus assembly protein protease CpaA